MDGTSSGDQPDDPRTGWTDPRYAELVAAFDESQKAPARGGPQPWRGFVFDLPAPPPSA